MPRTFRVEHALGHKFSDAVVWHADRMLLTLSDCKPRDDDDYESITTDPARACAEGLLPGDTQGSFDVAAVKVAVAHIGAVREAHTAALQCLKETVRHAGVSLEISCSHVFDIDAGESTDKKAILKLKPLLVRVSAATAKARLTLHFPPEDNRTEPVSGTQVLIEFRKPQDALQKAALNAICGKGGDPDEQEYEKHFRLQGVSVQRESQRHKRERSWLEESPMHNINFVDFPDGRKDKTLPGLDFSPDLEPGVLAHAREVAQRLSSNRFCHDGKNVKCVHCGSSSGLERGGSTDGWWTCTFCRTGEWVPPRKRKEAAEKKAATGPKRMKRPTGEKAAAERGSREAGRRKKGKP